MRVTAIIRFTAKIQLGQPRRCRARCVPGNWGEDVGQEPHPNNQSPVQKQPGVEVSFEDPGLNEDAHSK